MASLSASVISGRPASFRLSVQISSTRRYASALAGDFRQSKNSRIVSVVTLRAPSRFVPLGRFPVRGFNPCFSGCP